MPLINAGRLVARTKRIYKEHFSLLLFIFLAVLLGASLALKAHALYLSAFISIVLITSLFFYYYTYFSKFRLLNDDYSYHREYYFEAYSVWGVLVFNSLFVFVFAHVGTIFAALSPSLGFGNVTFYGMLLFLIQTIIDGITFGFLGSYSFVLSDLQMQGIFAQSYVYVANLIVDLAFIASIFAVVGESLGIKREFRKMLESDSLDIEYFSSLSPAKVKEIIRNIVTRKIDVQRHGSEIVCILSRSDSKQSKDIVLQIMQTTESLEVFTLCIDYFQVHKDYRFRRVCARTKDPAKLELLTSKGVITGSKRRGG